MLGMNRNGSTLADAQLTYTDLKVNDGNTYPTEVPIYVGECVFQDEQKNRTRTAISFDRDWLWIRTADKLCNAHRAWLVKNGFTHAEKRNGWHNTVSVELLTLVFNSLKLSHLDVAAIAQASASATETWQKEQEAKQEAKRKAEYQRLASGRTTVEHNATAGNKEAIQQANLAGIPADVFDPTTMKVDAGGRLRWKANGQYVDTKALAGKSKKAKVDVLPDAEITTLEGGRLSIGEVSIHEMALRVMNDKTTAKDAYTHGYIVGEIDRLRGYTKHNDFNLYDGELAKQYINGYTDGFVPPMSEKDKAIAALQAQLAALAAQLAELAK